MIIKRKSRTGANDLQTIYRPCKVDEVIGQETNKKVIKGGLDTGKLPHSHLFSGPPGCGKTTMARIISLAVNCKETPGPDPCLTCVACSATLDHNNLDVQQINVGAYGNKGDIMKVIEDLPMAPFMCEYKVMIFDEAHKLTSAAQDALLTVIEDGYDHVYFIFCTPFPQTVPRSQANHI
jgi:DNA polymerase-3 subunit gamma/tau